MRRRRWGGVALDDEVNKVRDFRSGRQDADLHAGSEEDPVGASRGR
jgi:hypothetical protein